MAFDSFAGTFAAKSTTGSQAITGVGFQPKVILFWVCKSATSASNVVDFHVSCGAATSSTNEGVVSGSSDDAVGTSNAFRRTSTSAVIQIIGASSDVRDGVADMTSLDSDGFTLNWSDAAGGSPIVNYLALGGADLTDVDVSKIDSKATTGNQAYTHLSFQPDCIMMMGIGQNTTIATHGSSTFGFGAAISATERFSMAVASSDNKATTETSRALKAGECIDITTGAGASWIRADMVSMDATGFTLNWDVVTTARYFICVSLKGGQYAIGTETQKTSTGTKATTGVGFQPTGLLFASVAAVNSASIVAHSHFMLGAGSGATERCYSASADKDAVGTTEADSRVHSAKCMGMMTAGTPTLDAEADLDSIDADGFTLDWTTADATAREFKYIAFGSDAVAGGTGKSNPLSGPLGGPLAGAIG